VVGRWQGGGTHTGPGFNDFLVGRLPAATGRKMHFTGTTVLRLKGGKIVEEIGLADLGEIWFRDQTARRRQKHLQSGQHFRLEIDALLAQAARRAQAARTIERPIAHDGGSTDRIRRAAIEAIEQCARLEIHPSAGVVEAIAG